MWVQKRKTWNSFSVKGKMSLRISVACQFCGGVGGEYSISHTVRNATKWTEKGKKTWALGLSLEGARTEQCLHLVCPSGGQKPQCRLYVPLWTLYKGKLQTGRCECIEKGRARGNRVQSANSRHLWISISLCSELWLLTMLLGLKSVTLGSMSHADNLLVDSLPCGLSSCSALPCHVTSCLTSLAWCLLSSLSHRSQCSHAATCTAASFTPAWLLCTWLSSPASYMGFFFPRPFGRHRGVNKKAEIICHWHSGTQRE